MWFIGVTTMVLVTANANLADRNTCEDPLKASRDTCNIEKAKALSKACSIQLAKDCQTAGMEFPEIITTKDGRITKKRGSTTMKGVTNDRRTTASRPIRVTTSNSKSKCENPVDPSRDTCKLEKTKVLSESCGRQLAKDCHAAGMGFDSKVKDCDAVKPSDQTCTTNGLRDVLVRKPHCVIKLKEMCKKYKDSDESVPLIPAGCARWFNGCNYCAVQDGKATSCTKKFCLTRDRAFCVAFVDKSKCTVSRATQKVVCKKPGETAQKPPVKVPTCDDITSDLGLSDKDTCRKALYLCAGKPDIIRECEAQKEHDEKEKCKVTPQDSRKAKCCVEGKLSGDACKAFGDRDTLPEDCKTRCFDDNGKFKKDVKECVRCRGKDSLRASGSKPDDKADKRPFDPARVKETIKEIASGLNEDGKKCVKRIAKATASLKARLNRWRKNKPAEKQEPEAETETKSLAEVQVDVEETVAESERVEDEFEDDGEGKSYREKAENEEKRLKKKMTESFKPKNQQCHAAFEELRNSFNAVVDKYSNLPASLKARGVERVRFAFADTDIGRTDLKNSESVCGFASKYVSQLKKAEAHHKTRLAAARKLLCTEAGEVLKKKLISKLTNCLRKATREAKDDDAKRDADVDADIFDQHTRKRVQKLLSLMKNKCLMKDTPDSDVAEVAEIFREKLKVRINKKAGELTEDDRKKIAERVNDAVSKKHPNAKHVVTTIDDAERRRLSARRALASSVDVQTTWTASDSPTASESVELGQALGADFEVSAPEITSEPAPASIVGTESMQSIDERLPSGSDSTTGDEVAASGSATRTVFGTVMCTTLLAALV